MTENNNIQTVNTNNLVFQFAQILFSNTWMLCEFLFLNSWMTAGLTLREREREKNADPSALRDHALGADADGCCVASRQTLPARIYAFECDATRTRKPQGIIYFNSSNHIEHPGHRQKRHCKNYSIIIIIYHNLSRWALIPCSTAVRSALRMKRVV